MGAGGCLIDNLHIGAKVGCLETGADLFGLRSGLENAVTVRFMGKVLPGADEVHTQPFRRPARSYA